MAETDGLIAAYRLDGKGGATRLGWADLGQAPAGGLTWVHLDFTVPRAVAWISGPAGLDPVVAAALVADETRPRSLVVGDGMLLVLRGINLNPGEDPEDMVSIRLWITAGRIVSVRRRRLRSVVELMEALEAGAGPATAGQFLVQLADRLTHRINAVINEIEEQMDGLEEQAVDRPRRSLRAELSEMRRTVLWMRRFVAPQREVVGRLSMEPVPWLSERDRAYLREIADHTARNVDELDMARDRATVTQEQLAGALAEQLNARTYVLTVVAAVFLPLGFVTGLLGINVGGIPLAESPSGFWLVCAALAAGAGLITVLFKWRKWF